MPVAGAVGIVVGGVTAAVAGAAGSTLTCSTGAGVAGGVVDTGPLITAALLSIKTGAAGAAGAAGVPITALKSGMVGI